MVRMIWIAAGPRITMITDGKMHSTSGMSIFVGTLAAALLGHGVRCG